MFVRKNFAGMTFIELILALVLSMLIINSIFEIYYIAEKTRLTQNALISIQENAQVVSQLLKRQIRASTYYGCAKLTDDFPFINHTSLILNQHNKIKNYQNTDMKNGTDGIQFWNANVTNSVLSKSMHGYSELYIDSNVPVSIHDVLMISDCKTAEIFEVKSVELLGNNIQKILSTRPLNKLYSVHAEINKLEMNCYYIGSADKLYERDIHGNKTELAENISQMKIFFYEKIGNQLIKHPINELINSDQISSISFDLTFIESSNPEFHQKWNVYAALS